MVILKCSTLILILSLISCGADTFNNPVDPANKNKDFDGDGILNGNDDNPREPDNQVVKSSGEKSTTLNINTEWLYFDGLADLATAEEQAPAGFRLPLLQEVQDAYAEELFTKLSETVWTTTTASDRDDYFVTFRLGDGFENDQWEKSAFKSLYIRE